MYISITYIYIYILSFCISLKFLEKDLRLQKKDEISRYLNVFVTS